MKAIFGTAAVIAFAIPSVTSAQSLNGFENEGRVESRAMVGVSIPLGQAKRSEQTAPRVDFSFRSGRIGRSARFDHDVRKAPDIGWQPERGSTLSLTLQGSPRLMLNGQRLATFGPELYADAEEEKDYGGGVSPWLIGGAAVLGVLVWATFETTDELEDIIDPD